MSMRVNLQAGDDAFLGLIGVVLEENELTPGMRKQEWVGVKPVTRRHYDVPTRTLLIPGWIVDLNPQEPLISPEQLEPVLDVKEGSASKEIQHLPVTWRTVDRLVIDIHFVVGIQPGDRFPAEGVQLSQAPDHEVSSLPIDPVLIAIQRGEICRGAGSVENAASIQALIQYLQDRAGYRVALIHLPEQGRTTAVIPAVVMMERPDAVFGGIEDLSLDHAETTAENDIKLRTLDLLYIRFLETIDVLLSESA